MSTQQYLRHDSSTSTLHEPQAPISTMLNHDEEKALDTIPTKTHRIQFEWPESDPENPQNWKFSYKCFITFLLSLLALAPSFGSSVISPANRFISTLFGISSEVTTLDVSLYVLGFAVGPLLWAPVSEIWGRKLSILPAMFCLGLFSVGAAVSQNPQSLFICRFFSGVFGSAPVSNVSAALGDIWSREARGTAVSLYAVMVVGGPTLAPVIGAALTLKASWRWTLYTEAIFTFVITSIAVIFLPEVYGPVLLKRRAIKMRKDTGKPYFHPLEEQKHDVKSIVTKQLSRPLLMLVSEPMVTCIAFYASFVYVSIMPHPQHY